MPKAARSAGAIALALALHGLVAYWAWPRTSTTVLKPQVVYLTAYPLAESVHAPAPVEPEPLTETGSTKAVEPKEPSSGIPPRTPEQPAPSAAVNEPLPPPQAAESESPAPPSQLDGYFPIDAVDQAAQPVGDWLINTDPLPRASTARVELWLWISASGKIDRWELAPGTEPNDLVQRALDELDQTVVKPALRNNLAVPSFRRLEIVMSRE